MALRRRNRLRLGDLLIQQNVLTKEQLEQALQMQKGTNKKIGEILVEKGFITEEMISRALEAQMGLKTVQLRGLTVPGEIKSLIDGKLLKKYTVFPFEVDPYNANILHLAMADPLDMEAIDDIAIVTNMQIEPYIATRREIRSAIDRNYGEAENIEAVNRFARERAQLRGNVAVAADDSGIDDAPIVQLVRSILEQAVRQRASDIHIEALENKVRVRYRIDGALCTRMEYDVRVSSVPTVYGEKLVLRISSKVNLTKDKKELGFAPDELARFDHMMSHPHGIIFVTGPTGSGKSTTLYTALSELNKDEVNIVTVEDPVEAALEGINQIQVNNKVNLTFATALRSILRQDPDIIMIGEIRDSETASIAVQASITGHLVVSTLHTNNATGTLDRMVDMGVERYMLADSVVGVIAQRLVRKLCPYCRKKRLASADEKQIMHLPEEEAVEIYEPAGCNLCNDTGYYGRKGIFEIMEVNEELQRLIAEGSDSKNLIHAAKRNGMRTLRENGVRDVLAGITSIEELQKASYE